MSLLEITDVALDELKRIAQNEDKEPRVRVAMRGGGCSGFTISMDFTDLPHDEEFDKVYDHDGMEFIVDDKSVLFLKGATLDFSGTLLGRSFQWQFPNSTGGCGCGTSFSF